MKKIFFFILALTASAGTLFAESGTCGKDGDNLTWTLSGGTLTISGTGEMADFDTDNIPWKDYISDIKSVVIEEGVTNIGVYAFYLCSNLTSATISEGVTSIKNNAFWKCSKLTSVAIPNSVQSIGNSAFRDCSALTSVTIGNGVTSIGNRAFNACNQLASITCYAVEPPTCGGECFGGVAKTIPVYVPEGKVADYKAKDGWKDFGDNIQVIPPIASGTCGKNGDNLTWRFYENGKLVISGTGAMADWTTYPDVPWYSNRSSIKSVVIEDGVTSIGENAFAYCTNLTSVSLPNSVTSMGWCAFTNCNALTSFTIPKSITSIYGAFIECLGLTSIIVESGNTKYDSRDNCNAIIETATNTLIQGCKNTIIPYSVTSIGGYAFGYCTGLTSIEIPNSVTSIGYGAFEGCSGLTSITCEALTPPTCGSSCFYNVPKTIPLHVPYGTKAAYEAANVWKDFTNIIEDAPTGIDTVTGNPSPVTEKVLRNGQLLIIRDGHMYNAQGAEVR